jgi:chromosome partitioning protein
VDVWALSDIAALVEDAHTANESLRARAVLNAADPGQSVDNVEAAAAIGDFPRLTLIDAPIRRRKAFANATGQGLSIDELLVPDRKASKELSSLLDAIKSMVKYSTTARG